MKHVELYVYKDDCEIEVLAHSSKNGAIGQNTLYSFSFNALTTVFVDTRLWKTKHSRKRFQNFRQSYVLSTYRIEIHQSQPASMT